MIEKDILERMTPLLRGYANQGVDEVLVTLEIENDENWRKNAVRWIDQVDSGALKKGSRESQYDVFISHASEDKEQLVRPLANALAKLGFKVWFDEFELMLGDSLSSSIDQGLAGSSYGIVVLSPAFFRKNWPQYELEGLTARQVVGEKVILPIWHNVTRDEILTFSPPLADRLAIDSSTHTVEQMVKEIATVLNGAS